MTTEPPAITAAFPLEILLVEDEETIRVTLGDDLEEAGFRIVEQWDASDALQEMLGRIKRNLLGLALAKASGNLPNDVNIDVKEGRQLLREAQQAVSDGVIGYGVYIAERLD